MSNLATRTLLAAGLVFAAMAAPAEAQDQTIAFDLGAPEPDPGREWTVMVYLDGDNDLEKYALRDLNEMEAGLTGESVEVVVLLDRAKGYDETDGNWTDARIFRVRPDNDPDRIASEELARVGEVNMGDPDTLSAFVTASILRFPARQTALVLWDHGGGWRVMALDRDAPAAEGGSDDLDLAEVSQGLRAGLAGAGVEKIDIVGFDMCLMAQLETAYELKDLASILVASQAVEPGDGWPYSTILPTFARGTMGPRRLGAEIVGAYGAFYDERGESVATLSAIDLSQVGRVNDSLQTLIDDLDASMATYWSEISRSVFYAESYAERSDIRFEERALSSVDLLDMLKRIHNAIPDFPAESDFRAVVAAMDYAVIGNYRSKRHRLSNGLAIYAPVTVSLLNQAYYRTAFAQQSAWPAFLKELHDSQAANLSTPEIIGVRVIDSQSGAPVTSAPPGGGYRLEATVNGSNVLWVEALDAIRDDENNGHVVLAKSFIFDADYYNKRLEAVADVIDLLMPEFRGNTNVVTQEFQGRRFYVSNGETAALATLDASDLSDLTTASSPILWATGGEEYFATVYFDLYTWTAYAVVAEISQPDGGVTYRRVEPAPEDRITVLFEFIPDAEGDDTAYLRGEEFPWGQGLELIAGDDKPGELVVAVRAESIGGRSSFAATSLNVEPVPASEQPYIDAARALTPDDLLGTWRWNGIIDGRWQALPLTTEFKWWEQDPSVLVATLSSDDDPSFPATPGEAFLDTRLTPTLRVIRYDDEGYPSEMDAYTLKVIAKPGEPPLIQLKQMAGKGWLVMLSREGDAPPPQPGAGGQPNTGVPAPAQPDGAIQTPPQAPQQPAAPSQQPAPQETVSLAGFWLGPDGMVLAMDDTNYEFYIYGELVDMGAYRITGNVMVTIDYYGERADYYVEAVGEGFALTDELGNRYVFAPLE